MKIQNEYRQYAVEFVCYLDDKVVEADSYGDESCETPDQARLRLLAQVRQCILPHYDRVVGVFLVNDWPKKTFELQRKDSFLPPKCDYPLRREYPQEESLAIYRRQFRRYDKP